MIRFLILAGYFELTMYLQLSGKLNQYINMHYSYLAYISMILSFLLSLCSETDAFIGSSLLSSFGLSPVLTFLFIVHILSI